MTALPLLQHLDQLASLKRNVRAGLFLDLDGTLAEIVALPGEASISPAIRAALEILDARFELVCIVTGRPAGQLFRFIIHTSHPHKSVYPMVPRCSYRPSRGHCMRNDR